MNPDACLACRIGGCLNCVLGAAPALLLGLFALGFNDNGSADGYRTGFGVLGVSQWLLYGGLGLLLLGVVLFMLPWFRPDPPPEPGAEAQDTSPLPRR